jgi:phosphatidylserine decarboxylase
MKISLEYITKNFQPIHKEGYIYIAISAFLALILNAVAPFLGLIGFIITIWCAIFFRNPSRYVPQGKGFIVCPADGLVSEITKSKPPVELDIPLDRDFTKITVELGLLDSHIVRCPATSIVDRIENLENKDKSSFILFKTDDDYIIPVAQYSYGYSSKITSFIKEGKNLQTGERIGIIRFCSKMEIYLPEGINAKVAIGQKMVAGETIIADIKDNNEALEAKEV